MPIPPACKMAAQLSHPGQKPLTLASADEFEMSTWLNLVLTAIRTDAIDDDVFDEDEEGAC